MTPSGAALVDASPVPREDVGATRSPAARRTRVAASTADAARLGLGLLGAFLAAFGYLFWRTGWGAVDATGLDSAIATAVLLAPTPAWLAWMLAGALDDAATPGQYRRGIAVRFTRSDSAGARLARFAIHPLSAPGWLWLAAISYLLEAPLLIWLFLLFAIVVTLAGIGSLVLLVIGRHPLHDLILRSEVEALR